MLGSVSLINFTDLTIEEKKMVLSWRNHPDVKGWMFTSENISLQNHLKFVDSLKKSADKLYFLVKQDNDYIGVIDFTNIDKKSESAEFGLYANTDLRGVGKVLLNSICEYGFNNLNISKLIAEVFTENEKAITLYKRFNFKETGKKVIKNREVICMELNYENR